ncbi:MAG: hypothetical protein WHS63_11745, partial [Tenuifilum sp.]|uniref:hypothetical protein n=1 Tax=Tenuifilum sp. TaxID=2760880 RepID=UPI0030A94112
NYPMPLHPGSIISDKVVVTISKNFCILVPCGNSGHTTATNTGFASGGLTCKLGALYFYLSSVLVDSFVLRNPPERKARNRWWQC